MKPASDWRFVYDLRSAGLPAVAGGVAHHDLALAFVAGVFGDHFPPALGGGDMHRLEAAVGVGGDRQVDRIAVKIEELTIISWSGGDGLAQPWG